MKGTGLSISIGTEPVSLSKAINRLRPRTHQRRYSVVLESSEYRRRAKTIHPAMTVCGLSAKASCGLPDPDGLDPSFLQELLGRLATEAGESPRKHSRAGFTNEMLQCVPLARKKLPSRLRRSRRKSVPLPLSIKKIQPFVVKPLAGEGTELN